jgi:hypothetical protein
LLRVYTAFPLSTIRGELQSAAVSMATAIRSDLDPKVRELAYLKVTQLTDCHV